MLVNSLGRNLRNKGSQGALFSLGRRFSLRKHTSHLSKDQRYKLAEILRQSQADLIAINSFITSQRLVSTLDSHSEYRELATDLQHSLKKMDELIVACGARPSILQPLLTFSCLFGGSLTGLSSSVDKNKYVLASIKKVMEDNFDQCLRTLTEEDIKDEEIRQTIVNIRDGLYRNRQKLYGEEPVDGQLEKALEGGFGVLHNVTKYL